MKRKTKHIFFIICILIVVLFVVTLSLSSIIKILAIGQITLPLNILYNNMNILTYENSSAYEFKNEKSNKLIINIEGSGWQSVLGYGDNKRWKKTGWWYYIVEEFNDKFTILVPEKLNFEMSGGYYGFDINSRKNYTFDGLVDCYSEIINNYLSQNSYSTVIIVGSSEGGIILPKIYNNLNYKDNILGLVSISAGGLSRYEALKILSDTSLNISNGWKRALSNIDYYIKDIEKYPDSEGDFAGYSYRYWNSFLDYRPFDDFNNINIPVLFIHGERDINVPVESTKYIQENLLNKPFEYLYFQDADHHSFRNSIKTIKTVIKKSKMWINNL
jgi:pimeloyl-ACP methyl ester carboxylesterase